MCDNPLWCNYQWAPQKTKALIPLGYENSPAEDSQRKQFFFRFRMRSVCYLQHRLQAAAGAPSSPVHPAHVPRPTDHRLWFRAARVAPAPHQYRAHRPSVPVTNTTLNTLHNLPQRKFSRSNHQNTSKNVINFTNCLVHCLNSIWSFSSKFGNLSTAFKELCIMFTLILGIPDTWYPNWS